MELKDLGGEHKLSGVDMEVPVDVQNQYGTGMEQANACCFRLDGVVYVAAEDPSDGYRSSMRTLFTSKMPIKNKWRAVKVMCVHSIGSHFNSSDDILTIVDAKTGSTILRVGTLRADDYYPTYVAEFHPEALAHNKGK